MGKLSILKTGCIILVFCAATAIVCPAQTLTTLASFNGIDGTQPDSSLTQATDGNFYGTTYVGGANNNNLCAGPGCGTVFKITAGGTLTTLYDFCTQTNCTDGAYPQAALVQATDGNFRLVSWLID